MYFIAFERLKKMAKKKAKKVAKKKKKLTCIQFLRELYTKDKHIANDKALSKLLAKFPMSKATTKHIITWKKMLRDEGYDIPLQRVGAKKKKKK